VVALGAREPGDPIDALGQPVHLDHYLVRGSAWARSVCGLILESALGLRLRFLLRSGKRARLAQSRPTPRA